MTKKTVSTGDASYDDSVGALAHEKVLRADARRNREKLLEVAYRFFTKEGINVSMDEIARSAGVGVGTIYRHFPTKEELFGAVMYNHKVRLIDEANKLLRHNDPGEAFFHYFINIIQEGIANKAITDALAGSGLKMDVTLSELARDFWRAFDNLLNRAQQIGAVRTDTRIEDIRALLIGIMQANGDSKSFPERIVSIICDGLRGDNK